MPLSRESNMPILRRSMFETPLQLMISTKYQAVTSLLSALSFLIALQLVSFFVLLQPMAGLIRSAKSPRDWAANDLQAYDTKLEFEDARTFFGIPVLPEPSVDQELLTTLDASDMVSDSNAELINLLDLAMAPTDSADSAVIDFAVALLRALGYIGRTRAARTRMNVPLYICGAWMAGETDVGLVGLEHDEIMLVVHVEKRSGHACESRDAQHQLVATAIASFNENNRIRQASGRAAVKSQVGLLYRVNCSA